MAAATASSGHIRKRQFQPSITSYFDRHGSSHSDTAHARSPMSPPLDAETQSSLLSVGMRVRKSVPEGYKTHKMLGMDASSFSSTAPAMPVGTARLPHNASSTRELVPFCGLHKVGGWGTQTSAYPPPSSAPPALYGHSSVDGDPVPALDTSQSTIASTQSTILLSTVPQASSGTKRSHEDDELDEFDACFDEFYPDEDFEDSRTRASRPIAKPRSGIRRAPTSTTAGVEIAVEGDFDEASFLTPLETMDVDE